MNILHLSDIHFGRNYPRYGLKDPFSKHQDVLDQLIELVGNISDSMKPEHIVFTGDIAWHGKDDEYEEAFHFFRRLLDALHLTGNDISFCVGNHDVDTMYTCIDETLGNYDIEKIDEYYKYENIHKFNPKLQAFNEFCHRLQVTPYKYPVDEELRYSYAVGYKDVPSKSGEIIRLFSFNTAMLFGSKNISEDMMWLGKPQVDSLVKYGLMNAGNNIYSIALFHHSDRFLHPNENYTYDGRDATLPLIMKNVNLLLCGHSESADKPRFTSQVGGAKMILSGATYYNDVHTNTFSTIHISAEKKSIVYFPYIWKDDIWQDYEFMPTSGNSHHKFHLKDIGYRKENIILLTDESGNNYPIDLEFTEMDENGIHNYSDLFNPFHFQCSNGVLKLKVNYNCEKYLDFMIRYAECQEFCKNQKVSFILIGKDGTPLASGNSVEFLDDVKLPKEEIVSKMQMIEKSYGIRLYVPEHISESEKKDIHFLVDMASKHHDFHMSHRKIRTIRMDKEAMIKLYSSLQDKTKALLIHDVVENVTIHLFTTDVSVGAIDVYRGPYTIDLDDLKKKIDSYCEGDQRFITFTGEDILWTYAIGKKYNDGTKFPETENIIVDNLSV